jgi:NAD(P)-dependent dehydrogenase (short-subunit alcohol dehydrogenase family)
VAISSVTASQGFAGRAAYSASKAAIEGMVRALAVEYAPRIRVNSLSPGFIMTDIARRNIAQGFISNESIVSRTPLGRWGKPEDVAAAVSFLLSDDADWITGAAIPVDGGWLALGM